MKDVLEKNFNVILSVAVKTVKLRYKNSILGVAWSMINPLIYLMIFVLIFSQASMGIENYPLYLLTGLIFWNFFASTTVQVMGSIINNAGILQSMNIPIVVFPVSILLASLINLLLSLVPFFVLMLFLDFSPGLHNLEAIPLLVLFACFTFGFSLALSTLNVFFRDVGMLWESLIPALFYLTPIAWTFNIIPERFHWILKMNPLAFFINGFRTTIYQNEAVSIENWGIILLITGLSVFVGMFTFNKFQRSIFSHL